MKTTKKERGRPKEPFIEQSKQDFALELQIENERISKILETADLSHEDVKRHMELAIKHLKDRKNDFISAVNRSKKEE